MLDREVERLRGQLRVQLRELEAQTVTKDRLRAVVATGAAARDVLGAELLRVGVDDLVTQLFE